MPPVTEITIQTYDYATGETTRNDYVRVEYDFCLTRWWKVYKGVPSTRLIFEPSYAVFV